MRTEPSYLDPDRFEGKMVISMKCFGSLSPADVAQFDQPATDSSEWTRALAEECLFMVACGELEADAIPEWLMDCSPFGSADIPLRKCLDKRCAVAVFPLNGGNASPGIGHVWLVEGLNHRDERAGDLIPEYGVIFVTSHKTWDGPSWQLAGWTACEALKGGDKKSIQALGRDWIITGCVTDDRVKRVELGNKLELNVKKRTWLIPRDNLSSVSMDQQVRSIIRSANDVTTAWNHITGLGTRRGEEKPWPENVEELHLLVGANIKAQVASILLTPKCKKIVLWHSDSETFSKQPAEEICTVCRFFEFPEPEKRALSDNDIAAAEEELRKYFKDNVHARILFNITSGNRLMSYAVQTLARLHPNVELIYRELGDGTPHRFTHLLYTEFPPYSGTMKGKDPGLNHIKWDFLYGTDHSKGSAEFLAKLLIPSDA